MTLSDIHYELVIISGAMDDAQAKDYKDCTGTLYLVARALENLKDAVEEATWDENHVQEQ